MFTDPIDRPNHLSAQARLLRRIAATPRPAVDNQGRPTDEGLRFHYDINGRLERVERNEPKKDKKG